MGGVDLDFVGVGHAHVVAIYFTQICVGVGRSHEASAFKLDFREGKYVLDVS